VLFNI
jgi:hypothetical protein